MGKPDNRSCRRASKSVFLRHAARNGESARLTALDPLPEDAARFRKNLPTGAFALGWALIPRTFKHPFLGDTSRIPDPANKYWRFHHFPPIRDLGAT